MGGVFQNYGIDPIIKSVFGKDPLADAIFGKKPKDPTVAAAAPPDKSASVAAVQEAERQRRMVAGRASTVLASPLSGEPETATKKLLGQ